MRGFALITQTEEVIPMNIIDAHLHFCKDKYFYDIADTAGHFNTAEHLEEQYQMLDIAAGVVMGNRDLSMENHQYPPFLKYCIGLDTEYLDKKQIEAAAQQVEEHLKLANCVGLKLYPGYNDIYVTDPIYDSVYELAEKYDKVVAIHTGTTASRQALLKYSHPLTLDEAATRHPYVQFVMCHFGNPWLIDAAAVLEKNPNVAVDLSGLLEGRVDIGQFYREHDGYIAQLKTWLQYFHYRDVMFGTDWPLVNLTEYIEFVMKFVPEKYQQAVFFDNANRIYKLGL